MITKIHQSKNLSGTMRYVYQEYKGAEVVDTSCLRDDLEGAQAEIAQVMEQRPEIKKPVFHAILSVPAGDQRERQSAPPADGGSYSKSFHFIARRKGSTRSSTSPF